MTKRNASLNARRRQFFAEEAIAIRRSRERRRVRKGSGFVAFPGCESQRSVHREVPGGKGIVGPKKPLPEGRGAWLSRTGCTKLFGADLG